ncbi:PAS domain-containing sensor histidine kinase [Tunicatimonas pelagia]|uniref:PAS domain-containing sensor histidine kinase n=1 Tax=Tunicatimonas pelagia TaxID=931531 RepID=UPI00266688ED|nr:histidine kinase [Tunicatimonas pelagia]WKN40902.1 histidine kinase [Tunicatimonas pelagia]
MLFKRSINSASSSLHQRIFQTLSIRYLLASGLIALTILASNWFVKQKMQEQMSDAHLLNLAGQQALLGQQLLKSALLLTSLDSVLRMPYYTELAYTVSQLIHTQSLLAQQHSHLALVQNVDTLLQSVQPVYQELVTHGQALVVLFRQPNKVTSAKYHPHIHALLLAEADYLAGMQSVVGQYKQEAQARIDRLILMQQFLTYLSLSIIVLVILFIFRPVARFVRKFLVILSQSRTQAKTLAQERQLLFSSLEKSHKYLSNIHFAVEQATLFAKIDCYGQLLYISPQFRQQLGLPNDYNPTTIPDLLQIPDADLKTALDEVQQQGYCCQDWACTNYCQQLFWLTATLVPVKNDQGELYQYLLLGVDITEKKEAIEQLNLASRAKIKQKVQEQRMRSVLVLQAQEEERQRIAMDLHDNIGQSLTALKYNVEALSSQAHDGNMRQQLNGIGQLLRESIIKVRQTSFHLMPSVLSDYGLAPVLKDFAQEMSRITRKRILFVNHTQFDQRMEEHVETNLYRIVQESLTNALKYAQATQIQISLRHNRTTLWVSIVDDGIGFETLANSVPEAKVTGRGLGNMEERAKYLHGKFTVTSKPGKGTNVLVQVPLSYQKEVVYDNYRIS